MERCTVNDVTPGEVIVRAATASDAPLIASIWHLGWRDGHEGHVPEELLRARDEESFHSRALRRVADTTVVAVDGTIAGFVMVVGDEIEQVYVAREQRGSGVAAVLLAHAERIVASHGHRYAWLAVVAGNSRARRFYQRNGWSDQGPIDYPAATASGPVLVPAHRYQKDVTG
jgi:GNAT superfamily N-acetyltransferase